MVSVAMQAMPGFKIGADPELFVLDENGRAVTAEGLIPGTKAHPHKVQNGAVQVDGMAAEFNIDPVDTFEAFDYNIKSVLAQLRSMLPKGYSLSAVPCMVFDEDVWDAAPEKAKELGCTPDFNAWTGAMNPPPSCPDNPRLRTASGHLHIGWRDDGNSAELAHVLNCQDLVKQLDWYLGAWSLQKDPDPTRRLLYGKAGACRYKSYGVEYRVLSNFWLTSRTLRMHTWNRLQLGIQNMRNIFMPDQPQFWQTELVESLNTSKRNPELETQFKFPIMSVKQKKSNW